MSQLNNHSLRITKQRQIILDELCSVTSAAPKNVLTGQPMFIIMCAATSAAGLMTLIFLRISMWKRLRAN